ncbi:hypothetical protein [Thysanoplusia orichalcea nucleopolyhedrovirus]|uniref:GIY-YIG domain-containing protein n=1 Tax=Thysanoplusia orichalcea nucleopolyhedrovirus TaxID=101850 RepID=L0CLB6_9ABAC|nr:hypothetical protein [Thysanoplusia orichalcea nucleopolyhedrovirus]AGA16230.1 hypothetical protein [Thysanoplusia orichalcea nucleopolyhedrovirus]
MSNLYTNKVWCVYILRQDNGKLYTGITSDLNRRLHQHCNKRGAKCLRNANNLQLVYHSASAYDYKTAARMEYNLKRKCSKYFKLRLIKAKPLLLHEFLLANKL